MLNSGIELLFHWTTIERLLQGFGVTLQVALLSITLSGVLGTFFGVLRTLNHRLLNFLFKLYLEIIRVIPILVLLYLFYFVLPTQFHINLDAKAVAVTVFSIWGAGEMSDIVRGVIISLPKHQRESALAIGLNRWQLYRYVLLPQAVKLMLPAAVNLSVRMIMTTSLLVFIGVIEVVKVGQQIIEYQKFTNQMASFWIYGVILLLYFLVCYPLSCIAKRMSSPH